MFKYVNFNQFWLAVAYTYLVGFVVPLPGDRGYVLETYFPQATEVIVVAVTPPVKVLQDLPAAPDELELYVGSVRDIYKIDISKGFVSYIYDQSQKYDVDYNLVMGLIAAESSFNHNSTSHVGAVGYAQVWPKWHQDKIAGRNIKDPYVNVEVGIRFFKECMDRKGNLYGALSCYNGADSKASADRYYQRVTHRLHNLKLNNLKLAGI